MTKYSEIGEVKFVSVYTENFLHSLNRNVLKVDPRNCENKIPGDVKAG